MRSLCVRDRDTVTACDLGYGYCRGIAISAVSSRSTRLTVLTVHDVECLCACRIGNSYTMTSSDVRDSDDRRKSVLTICAVCSRLSLFALCLYVCVHILFFGHIPDVPCSVYNLRIVFDCVLCLFDGDIERGDCLCDCRLLDRCRLFVDFFRPLFNRYCDHFFCFAVIFTLMQKKPRIDRLTTFEVFVRDFYPVCITYLRFGIAVNWRVGKMHFVRIRQFQTFKPQDLTVVILPRLVSPRLV